MVRTQIQLTEDQAKKLKELAATSNRSVAALIRGAVDRFLISGASQDRAVMYRQALSLAGKYRSEFKDISVEHDRYLEKGFRS
jgi:hypothetical protein